jgi:hypothetical protein
MLVKSCSSFNQANHGSKILHHSHLQFPIICTSKIRTSAHQNPVFRQKIAPLLCMHKKRTEYRFELWYILLNILYLYILIIQFFISIITYKTKLNTNYKFLFNHLAFLLTISTLQISICNTSANLNCK